MSPGDACLHFLGFLIGFENLYPASKFSAWRPSLSFPIIFSILALIIGAIAALLYNTFESKIGGIEIELVNKY